MPDLIAKQLPNGLRVVIDPMPQVASATLSLWVDGAAYLNQPDFIPGLPHFVEHMTFKGTHNRTKVEIFEAIETSGGHLNAMTDKESTCFYAKVLTEQVPVCLDVLLDLVSRPLFDQNELALERQVILQEVLQHEDSRNHPVFEHFIQSVWPQHPLGQPVLGTTESVRQIGQNDLTRYHQQFYRPCNMILSIAGHVDIDGILAQLSQWERALDPKETAHKAISDILPHYHPVQEHLEKEMGQVHLCLGSGVFGVKDPKRFTLAVIDVALGQGMNSRLLNTLRQQEGWIYSASTFEVMYQQAGLFGVYIRTSAERFEAVQKRLFESLETLRTESFSAEEWSRAQKKLSGNLMLNLESSQFRAIRNARNALYHGRQISADEVRDHVLSLGPKDAHVVLEEWLEPSLLSCITAGTSGSPERSKGETATCQKIMA
ncbi:MAG: insulinase family protein [Cyanobacteria bacterium]|nr:insulinase family protein [Cyanobacteriota bacterium]